MHPIEQPRSVTSNSYSPIYFCKLRFRVSPCASINGTVHQVHLECEESEESYSQLDHLVLSFFLHFLLQVLVFFAVQLTFRDEAFLGDEGYCCSYG